MKCTNCGAEISGSDLFCPNCGADFSGFGGTAEAQPQNLREFVLTKGSEKVRKEIKGAYIILYICAVINAVFMIVQGQLPLDGLIYLGLAIWLHMTYSRAAAITALVVSIAEVVLMIVVVGMPGGWLIVVASILAVVYTGKAKQEYDAYLAAQSQPQLPDQEEF